MNEKRYFIAVPLPDEAKRALFQFCDRRKMSFPFRRWVYEEDYHITLKYLGACAPTTLEQVKERLKVAVSGRDSFPISVAGWGYFGRSESPRILWAGVGGDLTALHSLQGKVESLMSEIGFEKENRPYRPHVTLAKHFEEGQFSGTTMDAHWKQEFRNMSWGVSSIVLYRTDLHRIPMYVKEGEYLLCHDG